MSIPELQGPETSKVPKVVRRGCKRCFGPRGAKVSQESFAPPKPCFAPVQLSFAPVQVGFGALGPKDLLHSLLNSLATFEVSGPCSRHTGSQLKRGQNKTKGAKAGTSKKVWRQPHARSTSIFRSLGNGVRKNGVRNRCPYRRCGFDTQIPYRLPFWREFCCVSLVRVDSGVDTEFPYRVRIVDRGVDCCDPVCRHHFRFPDQWVSFISSV